MQIRLLGLFAYCAMHPWFVALSHASRFCPTHHQFVGNLIAGTRARGPSNSSEDSALAEGLLSNTKDNEEFSIVRDSVHATVSRLCTDTALGSAKALLRLSTVQHLYSSMSGRLRRGNGDAELLVCSSFACVCV